MHEQYQKVVDNKDKDLEDYAYRVKALAATKKKELEMTRAEAKEKMSNLEHRIEGYEVGWIFLFEILFYFLYPSYLREWGWGTGEGGEGAW